MCDDDEIEVAPLVGRAFRDGAPEADGSNAIVGAEDTIDAMDLRAFGTQRRTWVRELALDRTDWLVIAGFAALLIVVTALSFAGLTTLWVPEALVELAP